MPLAPLLLSLPRPAFTAVCLVIVGGMSCAGSAGEVRLKSGGRLTGKVETLNADTDLAYQVTTPSGTVIVVAGDQVEQVSIDTAETAAYAARAIAAPDTPEGQLALAKWCQQHHLSKEFQRHATRVVELDPNHDEARGLLNYRKVGGEWQTREQVMQNRGLVWYEGKYRTRQDIALREYEKKQADLQNHWSTEVKRWRKGLEDRRPERAEQAAREFRQLTEPLAAKPLVDILKDEKNPDIRRLLTRTAAQIDHQLTVDLLVVLSLEDPDAELRYEALESLVKSRRPGLTRQYALALKHKDNAIVNRAAAALAALGDSSAMSPLIEALITEHKVVIGSESQGDTYSLNTATGGFSFGGGGPQIKKFERRNPDVLTALVRLSGGENYGYFKDQWRTWLSSQAKLQQVDLRRDQ